MTEPLISRPFMPGYGIADDVEGALPWTWAKDLMASVRNPSISSTRPDGRPHVMPIWAIWLDEHGVVFSTAITSIKSKNLLVNPACAFYFDSDHDGLVVEGRAEVVELDQVPGFVDAYFEKYDQKIEEGPVWLMRPTVAFAFIETNDDFAKTATRWRFEA
jgi:hypothetical protein